MFTFTLSPPFPPLNYILDGQFQRCLSQHFAVTLTADEYQALCAKYKSAQSRERVDYRRFAEAVEGGETEYMQTRVVGPQRQFACLCRHRDGRLQLCVMISYLLQTVFFSSFGCFLPMLQQHFFFGLHACPLTNRKLLDINNTLLKTFFDENFVQETFGIQFYSREFEFCNPHVFLFAFGFSFLSREHLSTWSHSLAVSAVESWL